MDNHKQNKIGIFGGTFNPPHKGHISAALEFKRRLKLLKVLFIPDNIPPHKKVSGATPKQRIEMTSLAISDISGFEVSDIEIKRGGTSFAILTIKELGQIYKNCEFYLLCGSDMFLSIETWFEWDNLLKLCTLTGAARDEGEYGALLKHGKYLKEKYNAKTRIIRIEPIKLSSSDIREKIINGEDVREFVGEKVANYINQNQIYIKRD